jgi:hypothetical protein
MSVSSHQERLEKLGVDFADLDRQVEADRRVVELTDELSSAFLEQLESSGSLRTAARAIGVDQRLVWERRRRDPAFRDAWDVVRRRRVHAASNELFMSLDALAHIRGCSHEDTLDELLNVRFGPDELAHWPGVDQELLDVAREHLWEAAKTWAAAVVAHEGISVGDRVKVLDTAPENLELAPVAS